MRRVTSLRPVEGTSSEILRLLAAWEAADDPAPLVVATSGSTGRPKRVVLSRAAMRASAAATEARLGGPGVWVLNLPPTYVAGVQVLYRSVLAGTTPVLFPDDLVAAAAAASTSGGSASRRYVSLVPTQLVRALAEEKEAEALPSFDTVLVGGGPLDPVVRADAERRGIRVVQTYGMSETCGGCVYDGHPLDSVAVKVDASGEVLLAGPVLFDGYEDDPARTAEVLVDGWFRTADLGTLDEDGRLRILGRVDDVVISGGVKVPALAVEQQLAADPRIREVAVVGVPDPEWGERVVAVVAGVDPAPVDLSELRDLVEPRTWAPRAMVAVDRLPRLPNGKPDRIRIKEVAAGA